MTMAEPKPFPWDEAMAFAFRVLRLSPAEFWAMTPRELALAMKPFLSAAKAPTRTEFDALAGSYPDKET